MATADAAPANVATADVATADVATADVATADGEEVVRAVRRLVGRTSHWTPARWQAPVRPDGGTRADLVHALVQEIADLAATAEGQPRRPVPRLDSDLVLPDQLRVVAADLIAAAPADVLRTAGQRITEAAGALEA